MTDTKRNMVLRTVYLPVEMDGELRKLAFARNTSKNELIRECVGNALESGLLKPGASAPEQAAPSEAEGASEAPEAWPESVAAAGG